MELSQKVKPWTFLKIRNIFESNELVDKKYDWHTATYSHFKSKSLCVTSIWHNLKVYIEIELFQKGHSMNQFQ